jgi:hypothetical protein
MKEVKDYQKLTIREKIFGSVKGYRMVLNEFGKIADQCWFG